MINQAILLLVFTGFINVQSQEEEKPMEAEISAIMMDCSKEYPISSTMMQVIQSGTLPDVEVAKCFFACVYRKTGMLDDQGKLSVDMVNQLTMKMFPDNPLRRNRAMQLAEACEYVNQIPVKDGTRGCDRASMIFKCTIDNAAQYGLTS